MNKKDFKYKYIEGLINRNPIDKIFPITHKSNHGIPLDIWQTVCTKLKLPVINCAYIHKSTDSNHKIKQMLKLT